ncbi:MAG: ATP-dependent DNA helicase RecG [Pseudomonadota bacterium]|uniref:ATP-dependent DNA helicase RecG n=1 Tax=Gallaecimonas pentaromativorans TaxID=584787 RepID=UPI00067EA230|nr:ATP-dependent DNA helicase RecG [Gallaecimonas pentaromativorans]MED5525653.1 ATP-dependent DNA helicase RecG [Pseudomonadota bacterium]
MAPDLGLVTPISALKGVGPKVVEKLERLGLRTIPDLWFHLPLRYEDRTRICPISDLLPGMHIAVMAEVVKAEIVYGRRRMMVVTVADASGAATLRFFNFSAAQKNSFTPGKWVRAFGEIRTGKVRFEIIHPEYKLLEEGSEPELEESLTAVYPTTEGLRQQTLRSIVEQGLGYLSDAIPELIPPLLNPHKLPLVEALRIVHRPPPDVSLALLEEGQHPAQQRLALEELLAQQLSLLKLRAHHQHHQAVAMHPKGDLEQRFLAALPYSPTGAQSRVVADIHRDLADHKPMMRLVQGDVGAGKTLVAALAALRAISNGYQVALMAPTEILAEQHAINFSQWLEPLGIGVSWLAGKLKAKARAQALSDLASGASQLAVGTHALFQNDVDFANLALVIIDEQHRFGVHQRLTLREKGRQGEHYPHQLIMTATPIPRTLAMAAYADLDSSIIDELPPGRTPVTTVAVPDGRRDQVIARVRDACLEGRQAYWVCTLVEESEVLEAQAAEATAEALKTALPELRVGLVHGRMKSDEKQAVMAAFKAGTLNLLVATTVIEVGVDVPNASLMIIENPERLGLAQLHQLRGRVGRGSTASHCVLLYHAPLSPTATARLGVLRDSNDGFVIAQRDLEIRGPGELLGTRQTGIAELRIADLVRDAHLLPKVQHAAQQLLRDHPANADALIQRWLAGREGYANA